LIKKFINIKAPAKINLHLEVIGKRSDGYHELAMIMNSISLSDNLEFKNNNSGEIILESNNSELCLNEDNLIIKAAKLLKNFSNKIELGTNIYLKKNIPIGAGLAGGSTDAAATLIGLNKLWDLNIGYPTLNKLASILGSDVPFCLKGGLQMCFGRGEILEEFEYSNNYALLLIKNPNIMISTADVYRKYSEKFSDSYDLSRENISKRRNLLRSISFLKNKSFDNNYKIRNDLQKIVEKENNSVKKALSILSKIDDVKAFSMSGSGPSCYAIFENIEIARKNYDDNIALFKQYGFDVWICNFLNNGIQII